MSRKLFLLLVAIFAMVYIVKAEENVEEENFAETEEVAPDNKAEEDAEIKEIDAQEKAKEAQKDAEIKDEAKQEETKEEAEDKAAGIAEAEIEKKKAEKEVAIEAEKLVDEPVEKEKSGSWFSWFWPFGGSDDKKTESAPAVNNENPELKKEAPAVAEEAPEVEAPAVAEEAPEVKEPAVAEEAPEVKEPVEPKIVDKKTDGEIDETGGFNVGRALMFYIPNLLLNLSDVFSLALAVGAEAGAEVRITRFFQFGGQYGDSYFIEKGFDRRFGGGYDNGYTFQLAAMTGEKRYVDNTFGSVKSYIWNYPKVRINKPGDELYSPDDMEHEKDQIYKTKKRDFWAVGFDAGWVINVRFDIHPVQVVDFLGSIFFLDITGDSLK